jgi:hypothetical protein
MVHVRYRMMMMPASVGSGRDVMPEIVPGRRGNVNQVTPR